MTDFLFERRCRVLVAALQPITASNAFVNTLEVEGLRTQFKVTKTLDKAPNHAEITVTNLAETTRAQFQGKGGKVALLAGYVSNVAQIFVGDVRVINSHRAGADWETTIEAGDGERGYLFGRVSQSFGPGIKVPAVINVALNHMGMPPLDVTSQQNLPQTAEFTQGYAAHGPASRELTRVLAAVGRDWSIQDGRVQVLAPDGTSGQRVVTISSDTGLVGSPEYGTSTHPKKPPLLKVKCLLSPDILPGGVVNLQTAKHKGLHKIHKLEHLGDTAGGDWYTEFEAEVLP